MQTGATSRQTRTTAARLVTRSSSMDGDGIQDAGEPDLPGNREFVGRRRAMVGTTTTDENGNYEF